MSKLQTADLYEPGFFAWTQFQARELQRFEDEAVRTLPESCPYTLDDILGDIEPFDD